MPGPCPLTTPFIRAGSVVTCWGSCCLLCHNNSHGILCLCSCFGAPSACFFFPHSLSSSLLLSLQFLSRAVALLYHCSMEPSWFSDSINFLLIAPFIPLLNSSTSSHSSYPLPLAALLNSWTNSSIVLFSCSNFLSFATFTASSSPPPNSFFRLMKNSFTDSYSTFSDSNSSIIFSFYISTDPPCIYESTHYTCSSTVTSLIFILKYNLHAVTNSPILPTSPLKMAGLATSMWDPVLDLAIPLSPPASVSILPTTTSRACICACIAASCSYCW